MEKIEAHLLGETGKRDKLTKELKKMRRASSIIKGPASYSPASGKKKMKGGGKLNLVGASPLDKGRDLGLANIDEIKKRERVLSEEDESDDSDDSESED